MPKMQTPPDVALQSFVACRTLPEGRRAVSF